MSWNTKIWKLWSHDPLDVCVVHRYSDHCPAPAEATRAGGGSDKPSCLGLLGEIGTRMRRPSHNDPSVLQSLKNLWSIEELYNNKLGFERAYLQSTYLILTGTLTITLLSTYKFKMF